MFEALDDGDSVLTITIWQEYEGSVHGGRIYTLKTKIEPAVRNCSKLQGLERKVIAQQGQWQQAWLGQW